MEESLSAEASATLAEGRYRLIEVIGSGGMATVYRAFDARLQVPRAIKILLPALANRERLRARFEAEARTMALLEHRNIVRVYDVGSDGNRVYIVMELVEGGSLVDRLEELGPLPPRQAVDVCLHVLAGLAVSHSRNIVHRDIKPHNVLLTSDGEVRVTDFGIARLAESNDNLTKTGAIMGTWGFMAPEQRADSKGVDVRADLYSVAATLYSCVTNETPMDLFAAELDSSMLARVPGPLAEVIRKATCYDREERYADTTAMAAALREIRDQLPPDPEGTPPLAVPPAWVQPPSHPPTRPLADSPSDRESLAQETIQQPAPAKSDQPAEQRPTPTMVPDRTPVPPSSRDNYTFDALEEEASLRELEDRAVRAVRPAQGATVPRTGTAGAPVVAAEPSFLDPPRPRRRWLPLTVILGTPALAAVGGLVWFLGQEPSPQPVEPLIDIPADPLPPDPLPPEDPPDAPPLDPEGDPAQDPTEQAGPTTPPTPPTAGHQRQPVVQPQPKDPPPPVAPPADPVPRAAEVPTQGGGGTKPQATPEPEVTPEPEPAPDPTPAASSSPGISHTPLASVAMDSSVTISARVTGGRYKVTLYYRPASSGSAYQAKVMVLRADAFQASIKIDDTFSSGLEYHIKAVAEEPGLQNLSSGSGFRPHRAAVQ
jgi:serine/threonine protein kinase